MKVMKIVMGSLAFCVTLPIWFYLLHRMLTATNADSLEWFLYWAYVPISMFVSFLGSIVQAFNKEEK